MQTESAFCRASLGRNALWRRILHILNRGRAASRPRFTDQFGQECLVFRGPRYERATPLPLVLRKVRKSTAFGIGLLSRTQASAFLLLLSVSTVIVPAMAQQLYKYVDSSGKVVYTDKIPPDLAGRANEQLSRTGAVIKRNKAAPTAAELAAQEAERQKKREEEAAAQEEKRKTAALLNTYASEQDIDEARTRALAANEQAIKHIEQKFVNIQQRRKDLAAETEFHVNKPLPVRLKRDLDANELEIKVHGELLDAKRKETAFINEKYDEDKQRYRDLTKMAARVGRPPKATDR